MLGRMSKFCCVAIVGVEFCQRLIFIIECDCLGIHLVSDVAQVRTNVGFE